MGRFEKQIGSVNYLWLVIPSLICTLKYIWIWLNVEISVLSSHPYFHTLLKIKSSSALNISCGYNLKTDKRFTRFRFYKYLCVKTIQRQSKCFPQYFKRERKI